MADSQKLIGEYAKLKNKYNSAYGDALAMVTLDVARYEAGEKVVRNDKVRLGDRKLTEADIKKVKSSSAYKQYSKYLDGVAEISFEGNFMLFTKGGKGVKINLKK